MTEQEDTTEDKKGSLDSSPDDEVSADVPEAQEVNDDPKKEGIKDQTDLTSETVSDDAPISLRQLVSATYDLLTQMRTAIIILVILGFASFIGTLIPQYPLGGGADIQKMYELKPLLARSYEFLGFFDIYHTAWYTALLFILMLSVTLCTIPRIKKTWNRTMVPKFFARESFYKKLKLQAEISFKQNEETVRESVEAVLKRKMYRPRYHGEGQKILIDASKFRWAAFGSVAFHVSFLVVAFGIIFGLLFGFNGFLEIIEEDTGQVKEGNFTQVRAEGSLFQGHNDFGLTVTAFNVISGPGGGPRGFISHVRILDKKGEYQESTEIRMNKPLDWNGYRIFQQTYGFSPSIKVTDATGDVLADGPVKFFFGQDQSYGQGYLDFPGRDNLTFQMAVVPTNAVANPGKPFIDMRVMTGSDNPQQIFQGRVDEGDSVTILGNKFEFIKMMEYTGLNVVYNPGITILYFGFTLGSLAILFSLYFHERRIWVMIEPSGKHYKVLMGGLASRNMVQFTQEFDQLRDEIEQVSKGYRN